MSKKYKKRNIALAFAGATLLAGTLASSQVYGDGPDIKQNAPSVLERIAQHGSDGKYDNYEIFYTGDYSEIMDATYQVNSKHKYRVTMEINGTKSHKKVTLGGGGSATAKKFKNGRLILLSSAHVFQKPSNADVRKRLTGQTKPITYGVPALDLISPQTSFTVNHIASQYTLRYNKKDYGLDILARDDAIDAIAIATRIGDKNVMSKATVHTSNGNSQELRVGHYVHVAGYPLLISNQKLEGKISSNKKANIVFPKSVAFIDRTAAPGNSGGGVYAMRDGHLEYVGIMQLKVYDTLSGFVKLEYIEDFLKDNDLEYILH